MSGPLVASDEDVTAAATRGDDVAVGPDEDTAPRPASTDRARRLGRRLWPWAAVALPVAALAWRAWERRWMTDDGFINLRVVDMILSGHGPVFNAGERVEVTTSTLWVWVLVVGELVLPLPLEWIAILLGIALTVAGLMLITAASVSLWQSATGIDTAEGAAGTGRTFWLPAGSALLVALPPVADYATSGLEGGLTFAWVGAVAWTLARWAQPATTDIQSPAGSTVPVDATAADGWSSATGSTVPVDRSADDADGQSSAVGSTVSVDGDAGDAVDGGAGVAAAGDVGGRASDIGGRASGGGGLRGRRGWGAGSGRAGMGMLAAVLVGLGPLVRPDAAVVSAVVLGGVLVGQWRDGGWLARGRLVVAAVALPVAYQIFRMGYYAAVVPNTALAKNAGRARWDTGWFYLTDLFRTYWLLVPLLLLLGAAGAPLAAAIRRRRDARLLVATAALPLAGVFQAVYIVRVGGDYMHARLLLPALWAVVAPFAVVPLPLPALRTLRRSTAALRFGLLAGLGAWVVVCAVGGGLRHPGIRFGPHSVVADGRNGLARGLGVTHPISAADHNWGEDTVALHDLDISLVWAEAEPLPADPPDDLQTPATAMWGVGAVGYALGPDFYIVDMLGLADPIQSRLIVEHAAQPGHEKTMPHAWLVARVSEAPIDPELLPRPALVGMLYESPPGQFDDDVEAARTVLQCPELQELLDAVRQPLTPARFLDNLVDAPRLTRIEIPPNPQEAEASLC